MTTRLSNKEIDILSNIKPKDTWDTLKNTTMVWNIAGGLNIGEDAIGVVCANHLKKIARKKNTTPKEIIQGCPSLKKRLVSSVKEQREREVSRKKAEAKKAKEDADPTQALLKQLIAQGESQKKALAEQRIDKNIQNVVSSKSFEEINQPIVPKSGRGADELLRQNLNPQQYQELQENLGGFVPNFARKYGSPTRANLKRFKEDQRQEFQDYAPSEAGSFVSRNTSSYASTFAPDPLNMRDEALFRAGLVYDKDKQSFVRPPRSEAGSYYTDTSSDPSIAPVKEESNPAFTPRDPTTGLFPPPDLEASQEGIFGERWSRSEGLQQNPAPPVPPRLNLNISEPRRPSPEEIQQEIERTDAMAQQIHTLAGANPEAGFI